MKPDLWFTTFCLMTACAKPYSRGVPKVLFVTRRGAMREVIEIAEWMSLDDKVFAARAPKRFLKQEYMQ